MKQIWPILFFLCAALISCEYPCSNATSTISFVNFPSNETDTVIVRKFSKSENFTKILDSFVLNNLTSGYYQSNDTLKIIESYKTDNGLLSSYEYEIFLPEISKTYKITEIVEEFRSINRGLSNTKEGCLNSIRSYKVNGELKPGNLFGGTFYLNR